MKTLNTYNESIVAHAIDGLKDLEPNTVYACDLHHELFNTDYFIIYHDRATKWLKDNNIDAFDAIGNIQDYEIDNFGAMSTDLSSPEKVVNMYAYIKGEELLNDLDSLHSQIMRDDNMLMMNQEDINEIIEELENL